MIHRFLRLFSVATLASIGLVAACSGSDRPAASGDVGSSTPSVPTSGGTSGSVPEGGAGGGAEGGAPADLCATTMQLGNLVDEEHIAGEQPDALGGTLVPGTYVLASAEAYGASQAGDGGESTGGAPTPTGISARKTLVVTATTLSFYGARGPTGSLPADTATGFTYAAAGNLLAMTSTCPAAGAKQNLPFSNVSGAIVLFPDPQHREVYGPR